jgi:hypothetical protein
MKLTNQAHSRLGNKKFWDLFQLVYTYRIYTQDKFKWENMKSSN